MKQILIPLVAAVVLATAQTASAACYADFKAKRDNPLRLQYGVIALPDTACSKAAARKVIAARIGADGWHLLAVLSVFGPEGLAARKKQAGAYFLRY